MSTLPHPPRQPGDLPPLSDLQHRMVILTGLLSAAMLTGAMGDEDKIGASLACVVAASPYAEGVAHDLDRLLLSGEVL